MISKNDINDVNLFFKSRKDLELKIDDFSHLEVSWDEKYIGIKRAANKLNISESSILFIDDNIGELTSILEKDNMSNVIHAKDDAFLTLNALKFFPGIWRWDNDKNDSLRTNDLKANKERMDLLCNSNDIRTYLSTLKVELNFNYDNTSDIKRLLN